MTTRRWMIAVAVVALAWAAGAALIERSGRFARIAQEYDTFIGGGPVPASAEEGNWRMEMGRKYRRAARYPWLPVGPDPPRPE
jgi:hypothetical protein